MEFRVVPAPCSATKLNRCEVDPADVCACNRNRTLIADEWEDQEFFCTDDPDGVGVEIPDYTLVENRPELETFWIVASPQRDPSVIYFSGEIQFGTLAPPGSNTFNATDPNLQRVEANSYLRLYTGNPALPGSVQLQEMLFHSSCSQELWLFDLFGAFQLIEYEARVTGITGSFDSVNLEFLLDLNAEAVSGLLVMDFFSVTLLPADVGLFEPQVQEFDVNGTVVPPTLNVTWQASIAPEIEYIVVAEVTGNINGAECFDTLEQRFNCPRVIVPGQTTPPRLGRA